MAWKKNRHLVAEGFTDLAYLPRGTSSWDCTLAAMAYAVRRKIDRDAPDLNAWAARHCLPASARYQELSSHALVLWHGTSRPRATKIVEHGLFSKGGLWATVNPSIAHVYARGRSERYAAEGAMVCLVLDRRELADGTDCTVEQDEIVRFHHGLPAGVVEYVLTQEEMSFVGSHRARTPAPWPAARFKCKGGSWRPVQAVPVRYDQWRSFSSLEEFVHIVCARLRDDLGPFTALEAFSALYAAVSPRQAVKHRDVLDLLEPWRVPARRSGGFPVHQVAAPA